jgi:formylglycine-generating enzyme required for sulfatase activity
MKRMLGVSMALALAACDLHPEAVHYEQLRLPSIGPPSDIGAMIRMKGGSFMMGAPPDEALHKAAPDRGWLTTARPQHLECVPDFEIGKYEVTAKEFCEFLNAVIKDGESVKLFVLLDTTSTIDKRAGVFEPRTGFENAPAMHVQFPGAKRYCHWMSQRTGLSYRLPSEVEWEYVARGSEGRTYPWGESSHLGKGYFRSHYKDDDSEIAPGVVTVGMFPDGASPEGVHDLIGNVPEWCCNYFDEYTGKSITADPAVYSEYVNRKSMVRLHPEIAATPCAATRGHQYVTRSRVATGWVRIAGPIYGATPTIAPFRGYGFRVLREIE